MSDAIPVFISSKMGELDTERAIVREQARQVGLEPVLAEDWPPARSDIRQIYLDRVRRCPIYIGLFFRAFSSATTEEYNCAIDNPYREILIYIRSADPAARDPRLAEFLRSIAACHVYYEYRKPEDLLPVIPKHLKAGLGRMINLLMNLGAAAEGGLSWGTLAKDEPASSPAEQFLSSLGFVEGQYEPSKATEIVQQVRSIIARLESKA